MSSYPPPTVVPTVAQNAGIWHNHFTEMFVNQITVDGINPWSKDLSLANLDILFAYKAITSTEKTMLVNLINTMWTNYTTPALTLSNILSSANTIISSVTDSGSVAICLAKIAASSTQMWYDNGQPSANNTALAVSIPTYRNDEAGAVIGGAVGAGIGAATGGVGGAQLEVQRLVLLVVVLLRQHAHGYMITFVNLLKIRNLFSTQLKVGFFLLP